MTEQLPVYHADIAGLAATRRQHWTGCYSDNWQGVIVPDAFAHPAKFARGLISRIYKHGIERGYWQPGDRIVDPFGGVALGGLDAMRLGLHWYGCELEPRFVAPGNANINKWRRDLAMLGDGVGTATLLQGDSRRLLEVVGGGMGAAVSSPPYEADVIRKRDIGNQHKQGATRGEHCFDAYGTTSGQLGSMPNGDYAAAVSSPPYADAVNGTGEGPGARYDTIHHNGDNSFKASSDSGYGSTPGNVGNDQGDTFWAASRLIVEQTYAALKPGGYAAWVCKDFVRKGKRVPFSDQWEALCAAVGFEPVERIAAMLVDDHGDQLDIFGGATARRKERKSFFRRLAEAKGSPRIDHEDVIIMRKPVTE